MVCWTGHFLAGSLRATTAHTTVANDEVVLSQSLGAVITVRVAPVMQLLQVRELAPAPLCFLLCSPLAGCSVSLAALLTNFAACPLAVCAQPTSLRFGPPDSPTQFGCTSTSLSTSGAGNNETTITCAIQTVACFKCRFSLYFGGQPHVYNSSLPGLLTTNMPNITAGTIHSVSDGLDAAVRVPGARFPCVALLLRSGCHSVMPLRRLLSTGSFLGCSRGGCLLNLTCRSPAFPWLREAACSWPSAAACPTRSSSAATTSFRRCL
jgi:hypothetical protein